MLPSVDRRAFLLGAGALSVAAGCDRVLSFAAELFGDAIPERFAAPATVDLDPDWHLLSRTSFGPRPGDLDLVRSMGRAAFLDWQLSPEAIDDTACEIRTAGIDSPHLPASLLFELPPDQIEEELARYTLLQAVYCRRQLHEVLVEFWSDHFHVAIGKSLCAHLTPFDYRTVARRHALGRFRDLLGASALSPAMLVYLDGTANQAATPRGPGANENYARELLELHTLGVHGGYTQADIMNAARCLTGFVVRESWAPGEVEFVPERHDDGEKVVLGQRIPAGGGRGDVERLLDIVAEHPSTARHVSEKLARAFIAEEPPRAIVDCAAQTFLATSGDLRATVRVILSSNEFEEARGTLFKRPFRFMASALRALGADTHAKERLVAWLGRMGQAPFAWPTPDGYPTRRERWLGTLMTRFSLASALGRNDLEGTRLDLDRLRAAVVGSDKTVALAAHLFGRAPTARERDALTGRSPDNALGLALASPGFQVY
ncbi:MAG: DUF1800 domain-containing protein [Polyangiaceae bacterium]